MAHIRRPSTAVLVLWMEKEWRRQWGFVIDRVQRREMKQGRGALKVSGFCPGLTSEG